MPKFIYSREFQKQYKHLPPSIRKSVNKQIGLLGSNYRHPSLKSRKMSGFKDVYEARVSLGYRLRYMPQKKEIFLLSVGPHDQGLGKK